MEERLNHSVLEESGEGANSIIWKGSPLKSEDVRQILIDSERENRKEWREDARWKTIKGITKKELQEGSNRIEKLKYPPWDKRNEKQEIDSKVGFGKYAEKTIDWVKEHDERYYLWMLTNVPKFAAKVKLLEI